MKSDLLAENPATLATGTIVPTFPESDRAPSLAGPASRVRPSARWFDRATPLQLAMAQWITAFVMVYVVLCTPLGSRKGLMNLTESWGALERVALWQRSLGWLPGARADGHFLRLAPGLITYSFRLGLVIMFALQLWSFWQAWSGRHTSLARWLIGPVGTHLIMLLLVPSNADVFYYEISGHIANQGFNPYVYPIYDYPLDPIYPYNHWVEMSSVYGPLWTDISRAVMAVTGPDPVLATLVFKILLGTVAIALAILVFAFASKLTNNRALACAAGVLVAWEPNMMMETSGQAHNDPVMILLMTAGVMLAIVGGIRSIRGGMILVTASAAIKYVTLPVLGLLALPRLLERKRPHGWRHVALAWVLDGIAVAATLVAAFLPYWAGPRIFDEMLSEPSRNYSHPIWTIPALAIGALARNAYAHWFMTATRTLMQILTLAALFCAFRIVGRAIWQRPSSTPTDQTLAVAPGELPWWTGRVLLGWSIAICALAFLPTNIHSWYWTWPVVPVALLMVWNARNRLSPAGKVAPLPRWFWLYLATSMLFTMIDVTRVPTW